MSQFSKHIRPKDSTKSTYDVASVYDRLANDYDNVDEEAFYHNQYRAYDLHLRQNAALLRGTLLDVGCGTGIQVGLALKYADHVIGIDVSEGLLKRAKDKFPKVEFHYCDACDLPFPTHSFDTVISYGEVLSHIPAYQQALIQISRVLKPGGFFLFSVLNKWCIHTLLSPRELKKALKSKIGHWRTWACYDDEGELISMDLKTFSQHEMQKILEQNGFDVIRTEAIHITSLLVPLRLQYGKMNLWGRIFAFLGKVDQYISTAPFFRNFGYTKMMVARKRVNSHESAIHCRANNN